MKLITSLKRSGIVINKKKKIEISKIGGGGEDKKKRTKKQWGYSIGRCSEPFTG